MIWEKNRKGLLERKILNKFYHVVTTSQLGREINNLVMGAGDGDRLDMIK